MWYIHYKITSKMIFQELRCKKMNIYLRNVFWILKTKFILWMFSLISKDTCFYCDFPDTRKILHRKCKNAPARLSICKDVELIFLISIYKKNLKRFFNLLTDKLKIQHNVHFLKNSSIKDLQLFIDYILTKCFFRNFSIGHFM